MGVGTGVGVGVTGTGVTGAEVAAGGGAATGAGVEHGVFVLYQDSDVSGQSAVNPVPPHLAAGIQLEGVPGELSIAPWHPDRAVAVQHV